MTELVMCLTRQCVYTKQTTKQGSAFGFQTIPVWEPHSAHGAEWGPQLAGKLISCVESGGGGAEVEQSRSEPQMWNVDILSRGD